MPFLVVDLTDNQVKPALAAMDSLVPKTALRLFVETPLPMPAPSTSGSDGIGVRSENTSRRDSGASTESGEEHVDADFIQTVVEVLLALKSNKRAVEVLSCVLGGGDTLEIDPRSTNSVRPITAGISRRLRKVFRGEKSPLQLLSVSKREFFQNGGYKCIAYKPTNLGHEVYRALNALNFFDRH